MSKRSRKGNTRPLALNLATLSGIYAYMYCMMASSAMLEMPILGGALYMCGQAAMVLYSICTPPLRDYYSVNLRTWSGSHQRTDAAAECGVAGILSHPP